MGLPWSLPDYIEKPQEAFANSLQIHGFGTELLGGMLVDDSYYLEGEEASSYFYLIPVRSSEPVAYSYATFVADCLAFEHAIPFQALPRETSFSINDVPWTIKPRHRTDIPTLYIGDLTESYEKAAHIAEGLWFHPVFRYDLPSFPTVRHRGHDLVHLDFSRRYRQVAQALHLYNAALRQTDPLGQFLNYYRVIENLTTSNGRRWIERVISIVPEYELEVIALHGVPDRRNVPLLSCIERGATGYVRREKVYKRRLSRNRHGRGMLYNFTEVIRAGALARIDDLRRTHSDQQISKRFWNTNRCGISHGSTIRRHDLDADLKEILADIKLVRFLARLVIEEHIRI